MICIFTPKDLEKMSIAGNKISQSEYNLAEKILIINNLRVEIGKPVFPGALADLQKANSKKNDRIEIKATDSELAFAQLVKNKESDSEVKAIASPVVLDGKKFIATHSQNKFRIINPITGDVIVEQDTFESDPKERTAEIITALDAELTKQFNDKENHPAINRNFQETVLNNLRTRFPINQDGSIPIERKIFKAKEKTSLFSVDKNAMVDLHKLMITDPEAYVEKVEAIKNILPQGIRQIIFEDVSQQDLDLFTGTHLPAFSEVLSNIKVTEEIGNKEFNFELNDKGEVVQKTGSKYISPNYLFMLAQNENTSKDGKSHSVKLPKEYNEIVRFFSVKALSDMHSMITELRGANTEDIVKKFGLDPDMAVKMQEQIIANDMLPASSFIRDAAKAAFDELGLSVNANINMELKEGIIASIDAHIRSTLANSNYITYNNSKDSIEYARNKVSKELLLSFGKKSVGSLTEQERKSYNQQYSQLLKVREEQYNFGEKHFSIFKLNYEAFNEKHEDAFAAINKLQYLSDNFARPLPSYEPVAPDKTMIRSTYPTTPDVRSFLEEQGQIKWSFKSTMDTFYNEYMDLALNKDKSDADKERYIDFLVANGYKRIDPATTQVSEVKQIQSVNDKMIRELSTLMSVYGNQHYRKDGFYLKWGQPVNGRAMVTNDLQPQESKLVRSYIEQTTETEEDMAAHSYDMSDKDFTDGSENVTAMEVAISQGLDQDPDKNSLRTVLNEIKKIVDISGDTMTFGDSDIAIALERIVTTDLPMNQLSKEYFTIFDKGEGFHAIQTIKALKDLHKWKQNGMKGPFRNELTFETDAITSGMMITLMEIMDESSLEMLSKGGIFTEAQKEKWTDYTQRMLQLKYMFAEGDITSQKDIHFDPGSLIEAGNFHQMLIDAIADNKLIEPFGQDPISVNVWIESILKDINKRNTKDTSKKTSKNVDSFIQSLKDEEIFNDLYKTIGVEMVDEVRNIKQNELPAQIATLENNIKELKAIDPEKITYDQKFGLEQFQKDYNKLKAIRLMLNEVGELTPAKLRNIAKYPVMYFIYGASINSIRRNLGGSVGKESLIKAIKKYKKDGVEAKGSREYIAAFLHAYEDKFLSKKKKNPDYNIFRELKYKIVNEFGKIKSVTLEDIMKTNPNVTDADLFMMMDIDENMYSVLLELVDYTFGDSIEKSFDKKLGSVNKYRENVKTIEVMNFEFFNAKFQVMVDNMTQDKPLSKSDFDSIIEDIRQDGFGHDIPIGNPTSGDAIPLYKKEGQGENQSASFTLTFDPKNWTNADGSINQEKYNKQKRIYASLESMSHISNPRGAPTVSIHRMDSGAITATILGNNWLSIYDAVVQASNPKNINASMDSYNNEIFDQNANREILGDNLNKMTYMMEDLQKRLGSEDLNIKENAQKEIDIINNRMHAVTKMKRVVTTSTHKSSFDGKTVKSKVESPYILKDGEYYNTSKANIVFHHDAINDPGRKMAHSSFMDEEITEQVNGLGHKLIKRVYYTVGKKSKAKEPNSTMVMKQYPDKLEVIQVTRHEDIAKKDNNMMYREHKLKFRNIKVEYTINGKENIDAFLKGENIKDADGNVKSFAEDLTTSEVYTDTVSKMLDDTGSNSFSETDIENFSKNLMLNVIDNSAESSKNINKYFDGETKEFFGSTDAESGFITEMKNLNLAVFDVNRILDRVLSDMDIRQKNLQQKFYLEHMASPLKSNLVEKDGTGIGKRDIDTSLITDFMNNVSKEEMKIQKEFVSQLISKNAEDNPSEFLVLDMAAKFAKKNDTVINLAGTDKDRIFSKEMKKIDRYNSGTQNDQTVIAIPSITSNTLKQDGSLAYDFNSIDASIKSNATIVMPALGLDIRNELYNRHGSSAYSTKSHLIKSLIKGLNFKTEPSKEQINEMTNHTLLQNYLKQYSYEADSKYNESGTIVYKPTSIKYNDTIQNAKDLSEFLDDVINEC